MNKERADVWFVFGNKRIPGHTSVLTPMTNWFNSMCSSSWREGQDIDLTDSGYTASAFVEFLRYFYLLNPRLSMDNINIIIHLAEASMEDRKLFRICEDFLIKSLSTNTLSSIFELAELFEHISPRLIRACKEDICLFAEQIFRSTEIEKFQIKLLEYILRCESLACAEKLVFGGCIAWAKAACKKDKQDPNKVENLRAQLKNVIYQIRFKSMTPTEFAKCIQPYPGLFSDSELLELIDLVGRVNVWPQKFNGTKREYDRYIKYEDRGRRLQCKRYTFQRMRTQYIVKHVETTTFTCNRKVLFNGLTCERRDGNDVEPVTVRVFIQRCGENSQLEPRFNRRVDFRFARQEGIKSFEAKFDLEYAILIEPNYIYSIQIEFTQLRRPHSYLLLKSKVRIDNDIVIKFKERGIVTALNLIRIDKRNHFRRLLHNPVVWFMVLVTCIGLCVLAYLLIRKFKPDLINTTQL